MAGKKILRFVKAGLAVARMKGNPKLAEIGYGEKARGRNAITGGFQGWRIFIAV